MDNKKIVKLWDNAEYKPLRRPNTNSNIDNNKTISEDTTKTSVPVVETKDFNDILSTSQLSVDAKEWFPSSYTHVPTQSAQTRLQRIRIGSNASEDYNPDYNAEITQSSMQFDAVNLDILIQTLIYDPGQFDNLVDDFIGLLEPFLDDVEVAIKTAGAIFQYAIKEASFRYNAARLCCVIDEHYPLFRPPLHTLCEKELNSGKELQGLTLFLAELYMQLHYQTVYGRCLLDSLKKLLSSRKPDDIKSACQALKLAGYSLESYNKETLDEIFKGLELSRPLLPQSVVNLVESVFTLRRNNWGRTTSGTSSEEQNGVVTTSSDEDYVFYGPDGQEITMEEQEFLCLNLDDANYLGDESSDPDDLYNPEPEMDKEIQEAFREFVKMSKR